MAFTESKSDFIDQDDFAEEVTYTPYGGTAKTVEAIIVDEFDNQEGYARGEDFAQAQLSVHRDDVTAPNDRDQYTFRGYTWEVMDGGYRGDGGSFLIVNLRRLLA